MIRKISKLTIAIIFGIVMCSTVMFVSAQSEDDSSIGLNVGDVLTYDDGVYVVSFIEDGIVHLSKDGIALIGSTCTGGRPHEYVLLSGTSVKQFKISSHATNCYTEKSYVRSKCKRCGDIIVSENSSVTIKHKYPWLGNECKNVVNGVKCTHKK